MTSGRLPAPVDRFWWATGIEDTFVVEERQGWRRLDEYELQQHYDRWRTDLDLAAAIGVGMLRYGIPWYRVEPEPGRFDWSFPDRALTRLVELGIEPVADLVHYGTPGWLEGSFAGRDYPARVAAFAEAFAGRYRDLVRWYTPANEPFVTADICGLEGRWPPHLTGDRGFVRVLAGICRGIVATDQALRAVRPDAVVLQVEVTRTILTEQAGLADRVRLEAERQLAALELVGGRVRPGHPLERYLRGSGMTDDELSWFAGHPVQPDVLGLNYYPDACVQRWSAGPDGEVRVEPVWGGGEHLAAIVRRYHQRYQVPIMISESCANERSAARYAAELGAAPAGDSGFRIRWLDEAVATIGILRAEGVPVIGFTWWPLLDAVAWGYREGTGPVEDYLEPAGLVRLRPDGSGGLLREPLPVADRLRRLSAGPP